MSHGHVPAQQTNYVLKHILVELVLKVRLLSAPQEVDLLIDETLSKFDRAYHAQDEMLTEKQVSCRWPFLDVRRLQNMRFRGVGPRYHKLSNTKQGRVYYRVSDVEAFIAQTQQLEEELEEICRIS